MVNCKPAMNNAFLFQKIFGDADFIAAGQLIIPPGKEKPNKPTRDNTYVRNDLTLILQYPERFVGILCHRRCGEVPYSQFNISSGIRRHVSHPSRWARLMEAFLCILTVWIGNHYHIENVCDRDARLFFAQARKVPASEEDPPQNGGTPRAKRISNAATDESLTPRAAKSKDIGAARSSSMTAHLKSKNLTNGKSVRAVTRS